MDELRPRPRRSLDRPRRRAAACPRWLAAVAQLLLALRVAARVRGGRGRGPRPPLLPGLRPHRLRQPAARRHDASRSPTPARSSSSGAASSPGSGSWAQPGGFLEVDETVNQAAIRETCEETGLLVEPGEIVGLYTRLEAAVVTIAFEARIVGGTAAPDTRGDRDHGLRARGHPVGRDRLQDDDAGRCATGSTGAARTSPGRDRGLRGALTALAADDVSAADASAMRRPKTMLARSGRRGRTTRAARPSPAVRPASIAAATIDPGTAARPTPDRSARRAVTGGASRPSGQLPTGPSRVDRSSTASSRGLTPARGHGDRIGGSLTRIADRRADGSTGRPTTAPGDRRETRPIGPRAIVRAMTRPVAASAAVDDGRVRG